MYSTIENDIHSKREALAALKHYRKDSRYFAYTWIGIRVDLKGYSIIAYKELS